MKHRLFLIAFAVGNVGLIGYGMMALMRPGVLLDTFATDIYRFPPTEAPAVAYLAGLFRLLGFFNIVPGLLGLLLLQRYSVTRQTWILVTATAVPLLSYLGPIVFDNTVGSIGIFEVLEHVLFGIMVAAALLMLTDRNTGRRPGPQGARPAPSP